MLKIKKNNLDHCSIYDIDNIIFKLEFFIVVVVIYSLLRLIHPGFLNLLVLLILTLIPDLWGNSPSYFLIKLFNEWSLSENLYQIYVFFKYYLCWYKTLVLLLYIVFFLFYYCYNFFNLYCFLQLLSIANWWYYIKYKLNKLISANQSYRNHKMLTLFVTHIFV